MVSCMILSTSINIFDKLIHKIFLELLNTIDYCVDGVLKPVFQTCDKEKGKVVFQLVF